jgi:hypothetical protein
MQTVMSIFFFWTYSSPNVIDTGPSFFNKSNHCIKPATRFITHYHTLHVFNVLSTFKHSQNMMLSRVNTYNFYSNVKEIKKISVNQLFRQRVMASMIFTHGDNPKLLSDHVLTIFRRCDFLPKYTQIHFKLYYFYYFEMLYE